MLAELRDEEEGLEGGTMTMLLQTLYIACNTYRNAIMIVKKKSNKDLN